MITIVAIALLIVFMGIVGLMAITPMVIEAESRRPASDRWPVQIRLETLGRSQEGDEREAA